MATDGVFEVDKLFKLLVKHIGVDHVRTHRNHIVVQLLPHPSMVTQGPFTVGKFTGIVDRNLEEQNLILRGDKNKTAGSEESLNSQEEDSMDQGKENLIFTPIEASFRQRIEPSPLIVDYLD